MSYNNTGSVAIGTSNTQIFAANSNRRYAAICFDAAGGDLYLGLGTGAARGKGILLLSRGSTFEIGKDNGFSGVINGIGSWNAPINVTVVEW
jgi:hypothetical protein